MKPSKIFALLLFFVTSFGYVTAMQQRAQQRGQATQKFASAARESAERWIAHVKGARNSDDPYVRNYAEILLGLAEVEADGARTYGFHALADKIVQLAQVPSDPESADKKDQE